MAASEPAGPPRKELSAFFVVVNGQVESGEFPDDDLYVRYGFSFGPDWTVVDGIETGLSQIARKAPGVDQSVVWNFPGENREVTRVESTGVVKVKFDVLTRGMETLGYQPAHRQHGDDAGDLGVVGPGPERVRDERARGALRVRRRQVRRDERVQRL
ncbi:hedgehog receptor [Aureococcus anophagefferens]|nr:hedgehog receptor [Aureococcus anophagefferens]